MCGFVALFERGERPVVPEVLHRMGQSIAHRGPDDTGTHFEPGVGLLHQRLSIIDLAGGHQPMFDASGQLVIVFNGEIYNYVELRQSLIERGATLRTAGDTEVLLQLYALEGEEGLHRLNGMFSFVLYDRRRQRVLAARDHFGIKPLYYHVGPDRVAYASEIKALLCHPEIRAEVDEENLIDYVTLQLVLGDGTLFRGVRKVLPGHFQILDLRSGALTDRVFWEPRYEVEFRYTEAQAVEEIQALLDDAIRLQVRSDVPLGAHLSGGTDSSLVTLLAARRCPPPLRAYHGRFAEGPAFDESRYARVVAEQAGAELIEVTPTEHDFVALLPRLIWHMDEPTAGPGLFPQYVVSARAARDVKVVLGGQGGDELFCGYTRYVVAYLEQALKGAIHDTNDEGEHIVSLASIIPSLPSMRGYVPLLSRFWQEGLFGPMDRRYFRLIDRREDAHDLYTPDFLACFDQDRVFSRFQTIFNHPQTQSYLNKMLHFDTVAVLPALLHVEDRVSMAVSLESRVPLLDHRLADLMGRLPPRLKFRNGRLKYLLRQATRDLLPPAVQHRKDKMGFPVPLHLWMRGPTADFFRDVLLSSRCVTRGLFDAPALARALERGQPFSRKLWGVLCLELWFQGFIDPAPPGQGLASPGQV